MYIRHADLPTHYSIYYMNHVKAVDIANHITLVRTYMLLKYTSMIYAHGCIVAVHITIAGGKYLS